MTPFLFAAGAAGFSFFWILAYSPLPPQAHEPTSKDDRDEEVPKANVTSRLRIDKRTVVGALAALGLALVIVILVEYLLFVFHAPYVLNRIDQLVVVIQSDALMNIFLGAIFGIIFGYWTYSIVERARFGKGTSDEHESYLTWDIVVWLSLLLVFIAGVVDLESLSKIARIGGNVKLPGGLELSLGSKND